MKLLTLLKNPPKVEIKIKRTDMDQAFILTIHESEAKGGNWFDWDSEEVQLLELSDFTTDTWEVVE